jgi:hypothetical protein
MPCPRVVTGLAGVKFKFENASPAVACPSGQAGVAKEGENF